VTLSSLAGKKSYLYSIKIIYIKNWKYPDKLKNTHLILFSLQQNVDFCYWAASRNRIWVSNFNFNYVHYQFRMLIVATIVVNITTFMMIIGFLFTIYRQPDIFMGNVKVSFIKILLLIFRTDSLSTRLQRLSEFIQMMNRPQIPRQAMKTVKMEV